MQCTATYMYTVEMSTAELTAKPNLVLNNSKNIANLKQSKELINSNLIWSQQFEGFSEQKINKLKSTPANRHNQQVIVNIKKKCCLE